MRFLLIVACLSMAGIASANGVVVAKRGSVELIKAIHFLNVGRVEMLIRTGADANHPVDLAGIIVLERRTMSPVEMAKDERSSYMKIREGHRAIAEDGGFTLPGGRFESHDPEPHRQVVKEYDHFLQELDEIIAILESEKK